MKKIVTLTLNPAFDETITVEHFALGKTNRVCKTSLEPAGKGINVARVCRRFYEAVSASGFASGEFLASLSPILSDEDIEPQFLEVPGKTRKNIKVFDKALGITTELNEKGFFVTEKDIASIGGKLQSILPETEVLVVTGSLPQGAPDTTYRDIIETARKKGVKTILDASGVAFSKGLEALPYAIKPNIDELSAYAGEALQTDEKVLSCMRGLIEKGISLVVTSLGSRGAFFMNAKETVFAQSLSVDVKSTVGAGDSMVALMALGLASGENLTSIAQKATCAGSLTSAKEGSSLCEAKEVLEKSSLIRIEEYI